MPRLRETDVSDGFHDLIRKTFEGEVKQANSEYPTTRSVRIDWQRVHEANAPISKGLLDKPRSTREELTKALHMWDAVDMPEAILRIYNIPEERHFRVGKQRTRHLGTTIGITGKIAEIDSVKPFAKMAAFTCRRCGTMNRVGQPYGPMLYPSMCAGCEKSGGKKHYLFRRADSELIDIRELVLQRRETNLDDNPPILNIRLTGDLVERLGPGDHVTLVGRYDSGAFQSKSILSTFLDTWAIENHEEGVMMDELPPEQIRELLVEEVDALQSENPNDFGADRESVVDAIADEGIRRKEVEDTLDGLIDDGPVDEISGGKLLT